MPINRALAGASLGPDTLRVAQSVFDAVWFEIEGRIPASAHAAARSGLANAILTAVGDDTEDREALRKVVLGAVSRQFPSYLSINAEGHVVAPDGRSPCSRW